MERTQIATTQYDAFIRAVEKEMAKFERQEAEFRTQDRKEREARLWASADELRLSH